MVFVERNGGVEVAGDIQDRNEATACRFVNCRCEEAPTDTCSSARRVDQQAGDDAEVVRRAPERMNGDGHDLGRTSAVQSNVTDNPLVRLGDPSAQHVATEQEATRVSVG